VVSIIELRRRVLPLVGFWGVTSLEFEKSFQEFSSKDILDMLVSFDLVEDEATKLSSVRRSGAVMILVE